MDNLKDFQVFSRMASPPSPLWPVHSIVWTEIYTRCFLASFMYVWYLLIKIFS